MSTNRSWKLLPKCDTPSIQLDLFQWTVVTDPLGSAFQFFVIGQEANDAYGTQHVVRYPSETNNWDAFTAAGIDFGLVQLDSYDKTLGRDFVLWNDFFCFANSREEVVHVTYPEKAAGVLSLVKTFSYPVCDSFGEAGLASYREELYFVGDVEVPCTWDLLISLAVWKLDFAKGIWVPTSVAPGQVLDDFNRAFPGQTIVPFLEDFTVADGMIVFNVRLKVNWNKNEGDEFDIDDEDDVVSDYPRQYVYFRFADNSWFSGSRFFCSNALRDHVSHGKTLLDNQYSSRAVGAWLQKVR